MKAIVRALAVPAALALAGCGSGWLGEPPPPPLEGERLPALALERELVGDAALEGAPVVLPPPEMADWPQHGGRADKAPQHAAAPGPLQELWSSDIGTGQGADRKLVAAPVAGGGRLFAMDAESGVTALDPESGRRLWRFDVAPADDDGGWGGGLAFDDGRLFVTTGYGEALALDAENGGELWRAGIGPPLRTPAAVSDGRLYLVTSANEALALDAESGDVLWRHRGLEETIALLGGGGPAVAGSLALAAYASGELYALRAENGRVSWSDNLAFTERLATLASLNDIQGGAVADRGLVFASSYSGRLVAIDLDSGARVWERPIASAQTPWPAGDHLYVVTASGRIVCLLRADGRIRWVRQLPAAEDGEDETLWSGPILAGGRLLVAASDGRALALSPHNGDVLQTMRLGSGLPLAPIAAGGTVFLVEDSGRIVALR